jgi:hypothetical protein
MKELSKKQESAIIGFLNNCKNKKIENVTISDIYDYIHIKCTNQFTHCEKFEIIHEIIELIPFEGMNLKCGKYVDNSK